jgi:endonuclease G
MKYGFPGTANVRIRENYLLSFDRRLRIANWVFEHFNKSSLKKGDDVDREKCKFFEDETEHKFFRLGFHFG